MNDIGIIINPLKTKFTGVSDLHPAPKPKDRVWVMYLNDKATSWQSICEKSNFNIHPSDSITWKFEPLAEKKPRLDT